MARGIERRLFRDDRDRDDSVRCLAALVQAGSIIVYAWALLPNHFHLLVRTTHGRNGGQILQCDILSLTPQWSAVARRQRSGSQGRETERGDQGRWGGLCPLSLSSWSLSP